MDPAGWIRLQWNSLVVETWRRTDEAYKPACGEANRLGTTAAVTIALALVFINFFGFYPAFERLGRPPLFSGDVSLSYFAFWSATRFIGYVIIPILSLRLFTSIPLSDMGVDFRKPFEGWRIYLVLYLAMLPALIAASFMPDFLAAYPFYRDAGRSWRHFFIWEALYGIQFIFLEFFFRGYMVHVLKRIIGSMSVPMMVIPYCMIHFPKPLPECLGSIVAGFVLGTLSLKTGKIWGGALLHIAVAVTMDALALMRSAGVY